MAIISGAVHAAPQGGNVVAGSADLQAGDSEFNVHQHSDRVVIEYDDFSVDASETVNFFQPDANSVALNRVVGNNLSDIHGQINANGQVFLINPNGVVFGQGAQVDVGSLVVSTLDIQNQDFMTGHHQFNGDQNGQIEIHGDIKASRRAAFLASGVQNDGQVSASEVVFYSGSDVYLPVEGSRIPVLVEDSNSGGVENRGTISAERVVMVVAGADDSMLRNDGLVRATSLSGEGGSVELLAPQANVVNVGTVDVSAVEGQGGDISVQANRFAQVGAMHADGAKDGAGGNIDLHAQDTIVLHANSELSANAGARGDGGEIIALAENATWYQEGSSISARGGDLAGDGGFVEVSGRKFVSIETVVDVRAPHGEDGLWYIDPTDITISGGGSSNGSFVASGSDYIWQLSGNPSSSIINGLALQNQLVNFGSVEVDTASAAGASGNITFDSVLDFNGIPNGRTLTLQADSNISFQASASIFDSDLSSTNGLNLVLIAGGDLLYQSNSSTAIGTGVYSADIGGNVTMFSSTLLAGSGDTTFDVGGIFSMNTGAVVSIGNRFTVNAGSNIQVAEVTSLSSSDEAIRLFTTGGAILNDGNNTTALRAASGGVFLSGYSGIADLDLDTDTLGLRNVNSGDVTVSHSGDLTLTSLLVGDNMNMSVTTDGNITFSGSLNADLNGSSGGQISLTSTAGAINLNESISDFTGAVDHDVDLVFDAATSFSVADGYQISPGTGTLSVTANNGDATVTGLYSLSNALNAITVNAPNGQILDGGSFADDVGVPVGGFVLNANGNIDDIETNSNFFDVVSTTGDISLNENMSFTAVRLQAAGAVTVTTGGEFVLPDAAPFSATDLSVTAGSVIRLPDAALSVAGDLVFSGTDITNQSNNRALDLNGDTLTLSSGISGGDLSIATDVNTLLLNNTGANELSITEADAVTVNQLDGTGDISLGLTTGNASFGVSTLNHSGLFSLNTSGAGQWIIPDAGLTTNGDLLVDVAEILDSDSTVLLSASDANITIRTGASATQIQSTFDSASINYQGTSAFTLSDSDGLQLDALSAAGNASISTSDADLTLVDSPTVAGDLSLQALNSGDVIVPAAGLNHANNLNILADAISDGDNTVSLGASNADITLRNNPASIQINSTFTQLDIDYQGGTDLTVIDTDGLIVNSVNAAGVLNLSSTDGDLQLNNAPTGASTLNLSAINSGDVIIPAAGLSYSGDLSFLADNISDGDQDLILAADNLQIQLRDGAAASTFNTTVNSLDFTSAGTGLVSVVEADALQVDGFTTAGAAILETTNADLTFTIDPSVAGDLSLQTNISGDVIFAAAGLSHSANLSILADALSDGDNTLSLSASNADITLRNAAADTTLNSSFDQLDLDYQGGSSITVSDSDALVVNSLNADADVAINSSSADLTLASSPVVAGVLSLSALTLGDLLIPAAGLSHAGELNLLADNISDGDQDITLAADNLQIQLRDGAAASTFSTTVNSLDFTSAGTGLVSIVEADALQADGFTTAGAANIETTNADLSFTVDPSVAGDLSLQTNTSGDVILTAAGLSHGANLSILADALSDGDNTLSLSASNADITLRNASADTTLNSSFDQLDLDYQGGSNITVTDSDALVLNSLNADGDATINSTSADLTLANLPTVAGVLSLSALTLGDVLIPAAGLSHAGDLNLLADNISDGDQDIILAADNLQIQLRDGAAASTFNTTVNSLDFTGAGTGLVSVVEADALQVDGFITAGAANIETTNADLSFTVDPSVAGDLSLQTNTSGDVVFAAAGLSHSANLSILADALSDGDNTLSLSASNADVTLRNAAADTTLNSSFDQLDLDYQGGSNITVTDADALALNSFNADANGSIRSTDADLSILNDLTVAGDLSLAALNSGNVVIPNTGMSNAGNLLILADAIFDGDFDLTLGANNADITLRNSVTDTQIASIFDQLAISYQGNSNLVVTDADALTVSNIDVSGDLSINSTDADLVITDTTPAGAGALNLAALNSGNVVLPNTGFIHTGALSVLADNVSDGDFDLVLGASDAQIELRDGNSDVTFNSQIDRLDFINAGSGLVRFIDGDALQVDGFTTAGAANIETTNADLTFNIDPNVAGDLSLQTTTSGDVIFAAAGLSHGANLSILADALSDGDNTLSLSASNADVTLRNAAADTTLNSSFDQLDLDYQGGSNITVTDGDALVVNSLNADGDVAINSSSADLTLASSPAVAGVLSLSALTLGDVLIPAAGLSHAGDLNLLADNISDGDQDIILAADNVQIQLRDGAAASTFNTSVDTLDFNNAGIGTVSVLDSDGLQVNSFVTGGDALLSANGADLVVAAQPTVPGALTLQTLGSGNVQVPAAGLVQAANLTILADTVIDDDSVVSLAASAADITLRSNLGDTTINSDFDALDLNVLGGGSISVFDVDALILNNLAADGDASFSATGADLTLSASPNVSGVLGLQTMGTGNLVLPAAGMSTLGDLVVSADALFDGDSSVSLGAANATLTLRNSAADSLINSSFDQLTLDYRSSNLITIVDTDALALVALSTAGAASITSNGDLDLSAMTPASTVAGDWTMATSGAGDLILNSAGLSHAGLLNISANTLRDGDASVIITAQDAVFDLSAAVNLVVDSQFDTLDITAAGPANITINEADALDLLAASVEGIFNLNTVDSLNITSAIDLDGLDELSLQSSGDLNIAANIQDATGAVDNSTAISLLAANNLAINDGVVVDAGSGRIAVTATAGNASVTGLRTTSAAAGAVSITAGAAILDGGDSARDIRAGDGLNSGSVILDAQQGILGLETAAADFQIRNADASDVIITDNSNIRIEELNTQGYAELNAGGALRFYPGAAVVASDLLAQATNMRLSDDGLSVPGVLELRASTSIENAESGGDIYLTASDVILDIDDSIAALNFLTQAANLSLDYSGADALQITNSSDLSLNALTYSGGGDVSIQTAADYDMTLVGPVDLSNAGAADLSLNSGADLIIQNTLDNRAAGVDNTGDITLSAMADFTVGVGGAVHSGAGRLSIDAVGTASVGNLQTNSNALDAIALSANRITQLNPNLPALAASNGGISLNGIFMGDAGAPVLIDSPRLSLQGLDPNASAYIANLSDLQLDAVTGLDGLALSIINAGDLQLVPSVLDVGSALNLNVSNGSLLISDAGLQTSGNLTIAANDIRDSDATVSLSAAAADLSFNGLSEATSLNTQFNTLDVNAQGADLNVSDIDALTLGSLSASHNVSIVSNNADLNVSNVSNNVLGDLSLATAGSGNVVLAASGFSHAGRLNIAADRVIDTDSNVQLTADNAQIQLRAHDAAATWQTNFNQLDLDQQGGGELVLINATDLSVNDLNATGPLELRSTSDLILSAISDVADLSLITVGDGEVSLPDAGASINGDWFIDSAELSSMDNQNPAQIAGLSANINIRNGNQNTQLLTDLDELSINFGGVSDLSIQSLSDLLVSGLNSGGAVRLESLSSLQLAFASSAISDLFIAAPSGQIQLSDQGLTNTGSLTIAAQDLLQSQSASLGLSAETLDVALSAPAADHSWQVATDALSVALGGDASLSITSSRTLELRDLSSQTGTAGEAVSINNGNFRLLQNSGDVIVSDRIRASADNLEAGLVEISNTAGGISVNAGITSDRSQSQASEESLGIHLELQNNEAGQFDIALNDNLTAIGGDILLNAGSGNVQQNAGSEISAYNNLGDALSGEVNINGRVVEASTDQLIRSGRKLSIIDGRTLPPVEPGLDTDEANDSVDDGADINRPIDEDSETTNSASLAYELAFGRCDELDESDSNRCRIDAALKAFLSHWLVGGEMPPKSEIRK